MQRILLLVLFCLFGLLLATPAEAQNFHIDYCGNIKNQIAFGERTPRPEIGIISAEGTSSGAAGFIHIRAVNVASSDGPGHGLFHGVFPVVKTAIETVWFDNRAVELDRRQSELWIVPITWHSSIENEPIRILFYNLWTDGGCVGYFALNSVDCTEDIGPCRKDNPTPVICDGLECKPTTPVPALPIVGLGLLGLLTLAGGIRLTRQK